MVDEVWSLGGGITWVGSLAETIVVNGGEDKPKNFQQVSTFLMIKLHFMSKKLILVDKGLSGNYTF